MQGMMPMPEESPAPPKAGIRHALPRTINIHRDLASLRLKRSIIQADGMTIRFVPSSRAGDGPPSTSTTGFLPAPFLYQKARMGSARRGAMSFTTKDTRVGRSIGLVPAGQTCARRIVAVLWMLKF